MLLPSSGNSCEIQVKLVVLTAERWSEDIPCSGDIWRGDMGRYVRLFVGDFDKI